MSLALTTDILLQSVGKRVKNSEDQYLGQIIEITRNASGEFIEYAILKSEPMPDKEPHYYAIPVSSSILRITEAGQMVLLAGKNDLQKANRINFDQCPSPDFDLGPSIFELLNYKAPNLNHSML